MKTPLREGEFAQKAIGGKEEREEGQNTQPETEEVQILANTHFKASSPSACSAVLFSRAVNKNRELRIIIIIVKKEKKHIQQV